MPYVNAAIWGAAGGAVNALVLGTVSGVGVKRLFVPAVLVGVGMQVIVLAIVGSQGSKP